jgi:uncharacterized protein (TIGR02996 family)
MTHHRAFLDAIAEAPEDDTNRLIFADWLADQDDPHNRRLGELVHIQTELVRGVAEFEPRTELNRRERELVPYGQETSLLQAVPRRQGLTLRAQFDRGLTHLTVHAQKMLTQREGDVARWFDQSLVMWVRPERMGRHVAEVFRAPWCRQAAALDLSAARDSDAVFAALIANAENFPRLRHLNLADVQLEDAAALRLAISGLLPQLISLDLRNNRLSVVGVRALLDASASTPLRCLEVHGNDLGRETLARLASWRRERTEKHSTRMLTNSIGMEFAHVPAGTFLMGSPPDEKDRQKYEEPQHRVTLTRSYYLGRYHVTQRQYEWVMGRNPSYFGTRRYGSGEVVPWHALPVEGVSHHDAEAFCIHLSEMPEEKAAGRSYRLPTEAEWEHACRAGGLPDALFALGPSLAPHLANFDYSTSSERRARSRSAFNRPTPGGLFPPNRWGLYDMHGNMWDWAADAFSEDYYANSPEVDPPGPEGDSHFVLRGGSWFNADRLCRNASRFKTTPSGSNCIGFRVVLERVVSNQ